LFTAINSPFCQLKDFNFYHFNSYSSVIEYPILNSEGLYERRTYPIVKKGDNLPIRKSIKFTEKQMNLSKLNGSFDIKFFGRK